MMMAKESKVEYDDEWEKNATTAELCEMEKIKILLWFNIVQNQVYSFIVRLFIVLQFGGKLVG